MKKKKLNRPNQVYTPGIHQTIGYPIHTPENPRPEFPLWGESEGRTTKCEHGINIIRILKSQQLSIERKFGRF